MISRTYGRWIKTKNANSGEKAVKMFTAQQVQKSSNGNN